MRELVIRTLTDQFAVEMAAIADLATDHRRALEWVKGKPLVPDRHQSLCRGATGMLGRDDRTNPPSLQALPSENSTGLQTLAQIVLASGDQREKEQRPNSRASQTA